MSAVRRRTLKSKLVTVIAVIMLATGTLTLTAFAYTNYVIERQRLGDIERQIRETISSKAVTLAESHALALRGLVQDNAFSDVRQLVSNAVRNDADIVYGFFIDLEGKAWAIAAPGRSDADPDTASELTPEQVLGVAKPPATRSLLQRKVRAFGQSIHECSAPVVGEDGERLGTIVYGFSDRRSAVANAAARVRSRQALTRALGLSGIVGVASLLAGILWALRSAARITQPVGELTDTAKQIASGKRGVRANIQSGDEVEALASAFNHMLQSNEQAMQKLEEAMERTLAADRAKSEFLANMSHEIRTPMNGVLGMIKLIDAMPLDSKLRRYVRTIDASANALLTIINDILDFSKMEAGKYTIQYLPFEPRVVLTEVTELLAGPAHGKCLELICRTSADVPRLVVGDPDRFRQILNNLIGNAIKFTDRGEVFVDVDVRSADEDEVCLEVAVHDTGIGIEQKDLPKLYEAFSQVDGSLIRKHGGTGLGLAICKRLVSMMGGDIRIESELGRGSIFTFSVRLSIVTESDPLDELDDELSGKRVLVVDPSRRFGDVLAEQLRDWHAVPESCRDRESALEIAARASREGRPFEAAVISADMRDVPLAVFVRALREQAGHEKMPVVFVSRTAATDIGGIECSVELQKPVRFSDVRDCLAGRFARDSSGAFARATKIPSRAVPLRPILVVDDNEINRFVAVEELERRGYRTEQASNGEDAVRKVQSGDYLCVLMDCQMPLMDGYQATRAIRSLEAQHGGRRTPIIALTAHALVGERERVLDAGMDDFLSKPFRPSSLERLLRQHGDERASSLTPPPAIPSPAALPIVSESLVPKASHLDPAAKRSEKLIRLFLDRIPAELSELNQAIARSDVVQTRALAHKIKGSCFALAAPLMAKSAEAIQQLAEQNELGRAKARFDELGVEHESVVALLERELAERAANPRDTYAADR